MDPWRTPVDRAKALSLISPFPDGTVVGVQQQARRGGMVVVATLTQTIRQDTWSGIRVGVVSPAAGEVDSNWFSFADHRLFDESLYPRDARSGELDRLNQRDLLQPHCLRPDRLRDAVEVYTGAFAPPADPEFVALARLGALHGLARRLDHVGSAYPQTLPGNAFAHAEVLREVASEIHTSLLPLAGESQAADSAPLGLPDGLASLRKLRTALTWLARSAGEAEHPGYGEVFRKHAAALAEIGEAITTDFAACPPAADGMRVGAARSTSLTAASVAVADRSTTGVPRSAAASGQATGRGLH
ncbi:hypothetical protein ABH931_005803 [Streptacidiphilus sp. MAP12-33]|uniref:hypothetical protein n=1 Tax=Streptacidiphilus sp. MAP12-33 TaxID=3156266 RepID=UPI00351407F0